MTNSSDQFVSKPSNPVFPVAAANGEIARILLSFLATAGLFYVNIMPALISGLIEGLGFTNQQAGFVGSANVYGAAFGALTAVFIIKKIPWKRVAAALLLGLIVMDLISMTISSPELLIAVRLGHGFIGGLLVGIGFAIISRTTEADRTFGYLLTIQFGLGGLGLMYLPAMVPEYGTGVLFFALIAFSVVTLLMLPFMDQYPIPKPSAIINKEPSASMKQSTASASQPVAKGKLKFILLALLATFLFQAANMGVYAYIIGMGKYFGQPMDFISTTLAVAAWIAIAGSVLVILLSTRYGRMLPVVIATVLTAVGTAILHFSDQASWYWLGNVGVGITWALVISYLLGMCADFDDSGQMAALGGFASKMGLATGPFVAALIIGDDNYGLLINIAVVSFIASAVVVIAPARFLDRRRA